MRNIKDWLTNYGYEIPTKPNLYHEPPEKSRKVPNNNLDSGTTDFNLGRQSVVAAHKVLGY